MDQVAQKEKHEVETVFPIAEIFDNYQGEGEYAGTMMTFIRFAGCNVGRRFPADKYFPEHGEYGRSAYPGLFPMYTEKCTTYDGREFACDTDYRSHMKHDLKSLTFVLPEHIRDVCITGGEPMMHSWMPRVVSHLRAIGKVVHIETSGTMPIYVEEGTWITVSPKKGVIRQAVERADEFKFLVDKDFLPSRPMIMNDVENGIEVSVDIRNLAYTKKIYLQPINHERRINKENLELCLRWQRRYPQFRMCLQMHKVIEELLGEIQK